MANERAEYVKMLQSVLSGSVPFSVLKDNIPAEERGFVNMLFMTTFRQLAFIRETVLPRYIKKKIPHKQQAAEYALYLGAAELLFMETPAYAVVNSYTEAVKKLCDTFSGGFVNAVLRNIIRNKDELRALQNGHYFSRDFLKILKQDYTPEEIKNMELFAGIEAPLDITLKDPEQNPFGDSFTLPTGSIRLPANTKVADLPGYADGGWWVQDAAAALAVRGLGNVLGKRVLDLCAAPGGKTAQLLAGGAEVTAVDVAEQRLMTLRENMNRLKLTDKLKVICTDALEFTDEKPFDTVLLDAPCSATGTFRRHPEIIHTKTVDDVRRQALLQEKLLAHAARLLRPGGILAYATCSLAKAEGERQIRNFTASHQEFKIVPAVCNGVGQLVTKDGFIRVLPQAFKSEDAAFSGADGFFIAYLQRKI